MTGVAREDERREFLHQAGFAAAIRTPMSGDASTRAYERLTLPNGGSLIFMDAPPSAEAEPAGPEATETERQALGYNALARLSACRVEAFVAVADHLRSLGLSAPRIEAMDAKRGFLVLEDLGDALFARRIAQGEPALPLYTEAVRVLARLQAEPPPAWLAYPGGRWPLLPYDDLALRTGCDHFLEWWPKYANLPAFTDAAIAEWDALWTPVRALGHRAAMGSAGVFSHRDYHAENLIWLPDREGLRRVGLIDFQDAVKAHPAWDLLHLLQDARRDVAPELEGAMLTEFLASRPSLERTEFLYAYHGLAALNAARILFIFARQVAGFAKPRYVDFMPRTWRALERNLTTPGLEGLRSWFDRHVPQEHRA